MSQLSEGNRLLSASDDGTIRLWNIKSGKELVAFAAIEDEYIFFTPSGHYGGSKGAEKYFRLVDGDKTSELPPGYRKKFHLPNGLADLARVAGKK